MPCRSRRSAHDVPWLGEERVTERRARERGAERVILIEAVEDQREAPTVLENGERGAAERIHLRRPTAVRCTPGQKRTHALARVEHEHAGLMPNPKRIRIQVPVDTEYM